MTRQNIPTASQQKTHSNQDGQREPKKKGSFPGRDLRSEGKGGWEVRNPAAVSAALSPWFRPSGRHLSSSGRCDGTRAGKLPALRPFQRKSRVCQRKNTSAGSTVRKGLFGSKQTPSRLVPTNCCRGGGVTSVLLIPHTDKLAMSWWFLPSIKSSHLPGITRCAQH